VLISGGQPSARQCAGPVEVQTLAGFTVLVNRPEQRLHRYPQ
jgi:hypothetical protein